MYEIECGAGDSGAGIVKWNYKNERDRNRRAFVLWSHSRIHETRVKFMARQFPLDIICLCIYMWLGAVGAAKNYEQNKQFCIVCGCVDLRGTLQIMKISNAISHSSSTVCPLNGRVCRHLLTTFGTTRTVWMYKSNKCDFIFVTCYPTLRCTCIIQMHCNSQPKWSAASLSVMQFEK